ncbi:hypothetical protein BDF14DRAFT_1875473 [Spinellus fusiger]|nr:hypothetical protein BDF14DRAFT_1875473 [Spinellus fusiger]
MSLPPTHPTPPHHQDVQSPELKRNSAALNITSMLNPEPSNDYPNKKMCHSSTDLSSTLPKTDTTGNSKRLPLRKRLTKDSQSCPVLKWQPVETPDRTLAADQRPLRVLSKPLDISVPIEEIVKAVQPTTPDTMKKPLKKLQIDPALTDHGQDPNGVRNTPNSDSTLYCFCRKPYDSPQFMIQCDLCDQWFHGDCIGISEKQSEFISQYFCNDCSKASYLTKSRLSSFADRDDGLRLVRVREEKRRARRMIGIVERKTIFLNTLEVGEEDMCGYDARLSWPESEWDKETLAESDSVCRQMRRCVKHMGWQKLKAMELEQEHNEQFTVLTMLERERQQIKARMKRRREDVDMEEILANGTIYHQRQTTVN